MTKNKIAFNLYGFIRVEMKQHNNGKWKVSLTNKTTGRINEVARSINDEETIMLCHYLIAQANMPRTTDNAKNLNKTLKNIIKHYRNI